MRGNALTSIALATALSVGAGRARAQSAATPPPEATPAPEATPPPAATPAPPAHEPVEAAAAAPMLDWLSDGPRDRHWGRMLAEVGLFFATMEAFYWADLELNRIDFEYEADWRNVKARFITLDAWRLDDNAFATNGWRHPAQGALNYLFARSNGFTALESYAVALAQSEVWELLGEYRESVSVNDIIVTPRAGSVAGEVLWQLGSFFLRGERHFGYQLAGNLGTAGKGLLDQLDGKPAPRRPELGPLGLPADVPHRFTTTASVGRQVIGDTARGALRVGLTTELVLIPNFARPGRARRLYAAPAYGGLTVEATRAGDALADLTVFARTGITSWHRKRLTRDRGYNLLYSLGSAYGYAIHATPGRDTASTRDQLAIGHIGGGTVALTVRRGRLDLEVEAEAYGDFALVRSYAIDAHRALYPDEPVRSTILRDNYHHALGATGRLAVRAHYRRLYLGATYHHDFLRSIQGLDRLQEDLTVDPSLRDHRGEGRAWLTYEHPLRPGLALAGEVSLEVRYRSGTIRTTTRSDTETRQFATLGLVF